MGGLCATNIEQRAAPSSVLQNTSIPEWVSQGGQELFGQAQHLAEQPLDPYGGPRVAPITAQQQQAFDLTSTNVGAATPYITEGAAATRSALTPWNAETAQNYMNPYQQLVTNRAVEELNRDFGQRQIGANAAAVGAQSFGGARHGILNAEIDRNRQLAIADTQLKGGMAGYEAARQGFNENAQRMMAGGSQMAQLGQLSSVMGAADVQQLLQSGGLQQQQGQRNLDTAYQDYLEGREYPYRQVNFALGALQGIPYETRTQQQGYNTQFIPTPSPLAQGVGALGAFYGGYNLMKNPNTTASQRPGG